MRLSTDLLPQIVNFLSFYTVKTKKDYNDSTLGTDPWSSRKLWQNSTTIVKYSEGVLEILWSCMRLGSREFDTPGLNKKDILLISETDYKYFKLLFVVLNYFDITFYLRYTLITSIFFANKPILFLMVAFAFALYIQNCSKTVTRAFFELFWNYSVVF